MRRVLAALAVAMVLVAAPAGADHCVYPPAPNFGEGTVDKTRVSIGECVQFSGVGFVRDSDIRVYDNGVLRVTGKVRSDGSFSVPLCLDSSAAVGDHLLEARGIVEIRRGCEHDGSVESVEFAERVITATVTVMGVRQQDRRTDPGVGPDGGALPRTGSFTTTELVAGVGLLLLGLATLLAGRPSRRRVSRVPS